MEELSHFTKLYNEFLAPKEPLYAGQMLWRAARKWPERIALICNNEEITFNQLYQQASAVSYFLQQQKVVPGDKVMILYENSLDFYRAYHGAWQVGAVVIPINTFMHEKELEHVINDSQPAVLIVSEKLSSKVLQLYKNARFIITQEELNALCANPQQFIPVPLQQHELSVLLYTSGTTGLPKGVMLSSYNCIYNSIQGIAKFTSQKDDRILCALPLFHSFMQNACIWSTCLLGAAVIVVPKIDRKALLVGIACKPTVVLGIPQLFGLFCLLKKLNFSKVRFFICGGDALPDKIRKFFELIYGRKICNGYGLSETSPFVSVDLDDTRSETNTIGKPLIGISVQLRDETGKDISKTAIGTLWVKGDNTMLGYYNALQATEKILQDGWLNTGDLARINSQGKLVICGREKDLIIHNGIKIYPQEIENCLMQHQAVQAVGVIGQATDDDNEIPVAYIAAPDYVEKRDELAQELLHLSKQHLAAYKIPRAFIIMRELPMTATGKINKKELRALNAQKS
ncbi:MAG: AMP-binding protein [Candidatus Babeliaceae bacterium]|nr:AMP-binding protein [Candidatus Babeliaceae bacterium]